MSHVNRRYDSGAFPRLAPSQESLHASSWEEFVSANGFESAVRAIQMTHEHLTPELLRTPPDVFSHEEIEAISARVLTCASALEREGGRLLGHLSSLRNRSEAMQILRASRLIETLDECVTFGMRLLVDEATEADGLDSVTSDIRPQLAESGVIAPMTSDAHRAPHALHRSLIPVAQRASSLRSFLESSPWEAFLEQHNRTDLSFVLAETREALAPEHLPLNLRELSPAEQQTICQTYLHTAGALEQTSAGLLDDLLAMDDPRAAGELLKESHIGGMLRRSAQIGRGHLLVGARAYGWNADPIVRMLIEEVDAVSTKLEARYAELFDVPPPVRSKFPLRHQASLLEGSTALFNRQIERLPQDALQIETARLFKTLNEGVHSKAENLGHHLERVGLSSGLLGREKLIRIALQSPDDFILYILCNHPRAGSLNLEELRTRLHTVAHAYREEYSSASEHILNPQWLTSREAEVAQDRLRKELEHANERIAHYRRFLLAEPLPPHRRPRQDDRAIEGEVQRLINAGMREDDARRRTAWRPATFSGSEAKTLLIPAAPGKSRVTSFLLAKLDRRKDVLAEAKGSLEHERNMSKRDKLLAKITFMEKDIANLTAPIEASCAPGFVPDELGEEHLLAFSPQLVAFQERARTLTEILTLSASTNPLDRARFGALLRTHTLSERREHIVGTSDRDGSYAARAWGEVEEALSPILSEFVLGGIFHDIGKLGQSSEVLTNENKLTSAQFEAMSDHTTAGAYILSPIASSIVCKGIQFHHKFFQDPDLRYQTTLFPGSIQGQEIDLAARCIIVGDTIDAIGMRRDYREDQTDEDMQMTDERQEAELLFGARVKNDNPSLPIGKALQFEPELGELGQAVLLDVKGLEPDVVDARIAAMGRAPSTVRQLDAATISTLFRMLLVRNADKGLHALLASKLAETALAELPGDHWLWRNVDEEVAAFKIDRDTWIAAVTLSLLLSELGFIGMNEDVDDARKNPDHEGYKDDRERHIGRSIKLLGALGDHPWLKFVEVVIAYHHASPNEKAFTPSREFLLRHDPSLVAYLTSIGQTPPARIAQVTISEIVALAKRRAESAPDDMIECRPDAPCNGAVPCKGNPARCQLSHILDQPDLLVPEAAMLLTVDTISRMAAGMPQHDEGQSPIVLDVLVYRGLVSEEDAASLRGTISTDIPLASQVHQTLGALAHRRTDDCLTTPQARLKMDLINHLFDPDESRTKFDPNLLTTFGHILETSPRCNGILERGYTHGVRDSHHDYELQKHCAVAASATRPDDLVRTHMGWIKSIEERRLVAPSLVDRFEETLTRIAAWMKDAPELSSDLSRAAFLHDIGKIERQRVAFNMRLNECEVRAHGDDANQHSGRGHERAAVRVLGNAWRGKAPVTVDTFTTDSPIIGSTQQTMRPAVLEGLVKDIQRTFPTSSAGAPPSAPTDSISSRVMHERHRGILSVIAVHQFPLDALRKMQEGTEALIREIAPHELPADRTERRAVLRQNGITWARTLLELLFREQESLQNRDITSEILIPSAVSTRSTSPRLVHGSNELLTRARTSLSFYAKKLAELERIAAERMELAREGLLPDDACILPRGVETPFIDCAFVMWLADFFGKKDDIALRADASDYLTMCMEIYEAARFLATQRDSA